MIAISLACSLLAACGSSANVDAGGFSSSDRDAAQTALNTLQGTSVSTIILQLSGTNQIPAVCRVHLEVKKPLTFKLFIAWEPRGRYRHAVTGNVYSWLQVLLGPSGVIGHQWHLGSSATRSAFQAAQGNAYAMPNERCLILAGGGIKMLAETSVQPV